MAREHARANADAHNVLMYVLCILPTHTSMVARKLTIWLPSDGSVCAPPTDASYAHGVSVCVCRASSRRASCASSSSTLRENLSNTNTQSLRCLRMCVRYTHTHSLKHACVYVCLCMCCRTGICTLCTLCGMHDTHTYNHIGEKNTCIYAHRTNTFTKRVRECCTRHTHTHALGKCVKYERAYLRFLAVLVERNENEMYLEHRSPDVYGRHMDTAKHR